MVYMLLAWLPESNCQPSVFYHADDKTMRAINNGTFAVKNFFANIHMNPSLSIPLLYFQHMLASLRNHDAHIKLDAKNLKRCHEYRIKYLFERQ